jgi:hypothetical protein
LPSKDPESDLRDRGKPLRIILIHITRKPL